MCPSGTSLLSHGNGCIHTGRVIAGQGQHQPAEADLGILRAILKRHTSDSESQRAEAQTLGALYARECNVDWLGVRVFCSYNMLELLALFGVRPS